MADFEQKRFLDLAGLELYTNLLTQKVAANDKNILDELNALKALINDNKILARIADLENGLGDVSQLKDGYKNVVLALVKEIERAKAAEEALNNLFEWGELGK